MVRRLAAGRGPFRDFDWKMCAAMAAIGGLGTLQVYSATLNTQFQSTFPKHLVWLGLGLGLFWVLSRVDYRDTLAAAPLLWCLGIVGLVAVLLFTDPINGSRRWLPTPFGFSLQVSEFMKVVVLLVLAKYCGKRASGSLSIRNLAAIGGLFLTPFLLVVKQPDLGTALSMTPLLGMALLLSRLRMRHFLAICLAGVLLAPVGWSLLKPYQKDRITGFLNPDDSPRDTGYQVVQSMIAVGSGGIWGQGFVQGSQTQLRFLPTPHTDFILAAFAEERGFLGVAVVLALYYTLLMRIVRTGQFASDAEGTMIAMGVAALLLFHIVVNVGMVANKLPVTGLPLPLMSYGGSSLLTVLAMLGLVNSVRIRRFVN